MKHFYLLLLFTLCASQSSFAVDVKNSPVYDAQAAVNAMTVNDFLAMDIKNYRNAEGKKLNWTQRLGFKIAQKSFAKSVKKGNVDGEANFKEAAGASAANKHGRLSLIFAAAGLVLLFIPLGALGLLGLGLSVAGFVLGILGLKRDEDQTMALIGTIISGLTLFLFLILIIAVAAFWSF